MNFTKKQLKEINKCYWASQTISNSSMLGGYDSINYVDIKQSEAFLIKNIKDYQSVIELGSGVGRITQQLLSKHFKEMHLVEREPKFIEESKQRLQHFNCIYYQTSVEDIQINRSFNLAWIQWISMYLTDEEFCKMLIKLKLTPIILKENISKQDYQFDKEDASITRSDKIYQQLIRQCGFKIIDEQKQEGLPEDIYQIKMYYLKNNDYEI